MAVKLNRTSFEYAKELVTQGKVVVDERDAWSEDQPSTQEENEFIDAHGYAEYAKWHLGIDDEQDESTKKRYKFPYGGFNKVHRCAVLSAESRAGQYKHLDIERAASSRSTLSETFVRSTLSWHGGGVVDANFLAGLEQRRALDLRTTTIARKKRNEAGLASCA